MAISDRTILAFSIIMAVISILAFGFALGAGVAAWGPWEDDGIQVRIIGTVTTKDAGPIPPSPDWNGSGMFALFWRPQVGAECYGGKVTVRDGRDNILATDVTVRRERKNILFGAHGMLLGTVVAATPGDSSTGYDCESDFAMAGLPITDLYRVSVNREVLDWTVTAELYGPGWRASYPQVVLESPAH